MEQISYYATIASFGAVILVWFIFAATFLARKKTESVPGVKRAPKSFAGLALQGFAFGLIFGLRRAPFFSPLINDQFVLNLILQISAIFLAAGSLWMAISALNELGRQWSLQARLIEDHQLITSGVYQIVRHPIYTAMFGMLIAIGIAMSYWMVLIIAVIVFFIGTKIRTIFEEKLLRDAFPQQYEDYAKRVSAFIPIIKI